MLFMFVDMTYVEVQFFTYCITFVGSSKDRFASPPAENFGVRATRCHGRSLRKEKTGLGERQGELY